MDFQRATSTKRYKSNEGYGTLKNGILKKSSSISDIAGLCLNNSNDNKPLADTTRGVSPDTGVNASNSSNKPTNISRSHTESPKVQFNEDELKAIAKSLEKDKKQKPFRKSLKRSAQSCPDLAALAEEKMHENQLGGSTLFDNDYNMGNNDNSGSNKLEKSVVSTKSDLQSTTPRRNLTVPRMETNESGKIPVFDPKKLNKTVSCPDFLNACEGLYSKDERKNRRLARNRASARLRRQRKRLMIDILEAKVRKLEGRLMKIKQLKWSGNSGMNKKDINVYNSNNDNTKKLKRIPVPIKDLGVDLNHPDLLDIQRRNDKITVLLQGIRANIDIICGDSLRASILGWLGTDMETTENTLKTMVSENNVNEIKKLRKELIRVLGLTKEQLTALDEIEKQNASAHDFSFSVFLKQCVLLFTQQRLHQHKILDNALKEFGQVCQERQQKKFLTWSGQNVVAISGLDFCGPKIKDIDKSTVLQKFYLQTNCSRVDGDKFGNLPSGQYFPRADDTSNLPVFFFGGRDSVY